VRRLAPLVLLEMAVLLSALGNGVAFVVFPWLVLQRTGSAAAAGVVAAATAVPAIVTSLFAGTVIDVVGVRWTSIVSDLVSLVAVAAVPLLDQSLGLSLWALVALAALGALIDPAGVTAREVALPRLATNAHVSLDRANAVHEAVWGLALLIGPGVGGLLLATIGPIQALWVTAAGFAVSILCFAVLRVPGLGRPHASQRPERVWRGTVEGIRFVLSQRLLRRVAAWSTLFLGLYLPVEAVLLPVFFSARDEPELLGVALAAIAAGGVAGSLLYAAVGKHLSRDLVLAVALVAAGVGLCAMATLPPFPLLVVASIAVGVMYAPVQPLVNIAMQSLTPLALQGRVFGVIGSAALAAGPLGYLVTGPLVELIGLRPTFLLLAGVFLLCAIILAASGSLRGFDALPTPPAHQPAPLPPKR
jgi:MFS family permease